MANVNPQAVSFVNNRIRPMADELYSCYLSAKKIVDEWTSQSVATVIPNDATIITDGAATDGRAQITNANATAIITRCQEFISWYEGTGALTATAGRGATIVLPQVNGKARF